MVYGTHDYGIIWLTGHTLHKLVVVSLLIQQNKVQRDECA